MVKNKEYIHIIVFKGRMEKFLDEQVLDTGNYETKAEIIRDGLRRLYINALEHGIIKEVSLNKNIIKE